TVASASEVDLTWADNSGNETGFVVERSADSGTTWAQVALTGPDATSYSDTGLTPETGYYYRVSASNGGLSSAYSNVGSARTAVPTAPSNLTAAAVSATQ